MGEPKFVVPRRRDRAVDDEVWIAQMLTSSPMGVLAIDDDDKPYLNPNLFVYRAASREIFVHTAAKGRLPEITQTKRSASFAVFYMGRILPAARAQDFSAEYGSVIVSGDLGQLTDPAEKTEVLKMFMSKYAPRLQYNVDYEGVSDGDLKITAVHALRVREWGAKRNAPLNPPGAFDYEAAV